MSSTFCPTCSSCGAFPLTSAPTTDRSSSPRRCRTGSRSSVPRPPTSSGAALGRTATSRAFACLEMQSSQCLPQQPVYERHERGGRKPTEPQAEARKRAAEFADGESLRGTRWKPLIAITSKKEAPAELGACRGKHSLGSRLVRPTLAAYTCWLTGTLHGWTKF